jgi:hypothetical protein
MGRRRLLNSRGTADRFSGVRNRALFGQVARFCRSHVKRADVQALVPGAVGDQRERGGFQGHEPDDLQIGEPGGRLGQRFDQVLGFPAGRADKHPLTGPDMPDGIFGRASFLHVAVRPV